MSLHVKRYEYAGTGDSGTPLLLIHGWGMDGGLWDHVAQQLMQHCRLLSLDLPGHGYSVNNKRRKGQEAGDKGQNPAVPLRSWQSAMEGIVDELSAQFSEPLTVCGWSLGGQLALYWAKRHPMQIRRLVLVASTPCFARRVDWPCAMPAGTLAEFDQSLQRNYTRTLQRFVALQARGSDQERELLATLRNALFSHGEPELCALQVGLEILRDCDLRSILPDIRQPVLVIAGERDMLTPPQASHYLASHLPDARLSVINGAAHAPFLSHTVEFVEHVKHFLNE